MPTPDAQSTLEQRLRAIEDRLEIYNLIASHPPSADAGVDAFTRAVYAENGSLDLGRGKSVDGREAVAAVVKTADHQAAIAGGLGHFAGLPRIDLNGDRAVVTSYLQVLTPDHEAAPVAVPGHGTSQGFRIHRLGANRWELTRTPEGWKVVRRTMRLLDGSEPARELLRQALSGYTGG